MTQTELYEEPDFKKFNYIRNSGVAVVNAYTGAVSFYAIKDDEAVMRAYRKAFPALFKSVSEMPDGLQAHLRYPGLPDPYPSEDVRCLSPTGRRFLPSARSVADSERGVLYLGSRSGDDAVLCYAQAPG